MNKKLKPPASTTHNWKRTTNQSSLFRNIQKLQQTRDDKTITKPNPASMPPNKLSKYDDQQFQQQLAQQKAEWITKYQNHNLRKPNLKEINLMSKHKLVDVLKMNSDTIIKKEKDIEIKAKKNNDKKTTKSFNDKKMLKLNEAVKKLKAENLNLKQQLLTYKNTADTNKRLLELEQELANRVQIHELALKQQEQKFNDLYLTKVAEKAQQADQLIDAKTKELEAKVAEKIQEIKLYGLEKTAADLIDIVSKFQVVVSQEPDDPNLRNYLQGFIMFNNMFEQFMVKNGIHKIPINLLDPFDPTTMEAFETVTVTDPNQNNKVLKILQPGFRLHDRVIKYTLVEVGSYKEPQTN